MRSGQLRSICLTAAAFLGLCAASFGGDVDPAFHPRVEFSTSMGNFIVELDGEAAPSTVVNFVRYVQDGFYDGTLFHRVLDGRLIQGGRYDKDMTQRTEGLLDGIGAELNNGLEHKRGTIAMNRISTRRTGTRAEFFINVRDNPSFSDRSAEVRYTVFGRVLDGMDVIDRIGRVDVTTHVKYAAGQSVVVPVEPIVINSARILGDCNVDVIVEAVREAKEAAVRKAAEDAERKENALPNTIAALEKRAGRRMTKTASGLLYVDIVVGQGAVPLPGDSTVFLYEGRFLDGTVFDSNRKRDKVEAQPISRMVSGLREAVLTMAEGGLIACILPPDLAFGTTGIPGKIPGNTTLVFELQLLEVKPAP